MTTTKTTAGRTRKRISTKRRRRRRRTTTTTRRRRRRRKIRTWSDASVQPVCQKDAKDEVKDARRAKSRLEGLPTRRQGPTGP